MTDRPADSPELLYYRRRLDEVAGESLRLDYEISGLRKEIKQKRQAFTLLSRLQQSIASEEDISRIFDLVLEEVNATLGMDATVVLTPSEREGHCRPTQWKGYSVAGRLDDFDDRVSEGEIALPREYDDSGAFILATKDTEGTPFIRTVRETFGLPFFVCVPVTVEGALTALLLSGRVKQAGSVYPQLDHADVETFQAIAGLIARFLEIRRIGVLEEMDRLKTRFFANISHEFRTPITLTLGPLEGILAGRYGEVTSAAREQARMIQRNQERLLRLVNELLAVEKLEAGRMPLRAAPLRNVNAFVGEHVALFGDAARERGIELVTRFAPALHVRHDVFVDREKLDALLTNLLSNALKFTREGRIEVATDVTTDHLLFTVSDTGVGIKATDLPHIFDRFRQADGSVSTGVAGSGLGLAWVKEITELHGGTVKARSEWGKGTTFTIELPLGSSHLDPSSVVEYAEDDLPSLGGAGRTYVVSEGDENRMKTMDELNAQALRELDPRRETILYVEDNPDLRVFVRDLFQDRYNVFLACDGKDGLEKARRHWPDLIIADQMMPRMSGREMLGEIKRDQELEEIPVVFLTARAGTEARVESLDAGADDYVSKPFDSEELRARVRNQLRVRAQASELREANRVLKARVEDQMAALMRRGEARRVTSQGLAHNLVSRSPAMQEVLDLTSKIAGSLSTVLLQGETGTGKEVIARSIHARSPVANGPFVPVHCAALSPHLLESELFGHEKGAFTGATSRRKGRFELANRGTLFLDEVGEIGPEAQVKLLRVLQEQRFERVGGTETIQVDVRIIAATNRDLEKCIRERSFREDLYYRINVIPIYLPPLRRRPEDIPLLMTHFLDRYRRKLGRRPLELSSAAAALLSAYPWPGNVREVQNLMERLVVTVEGDIVEPGHLPPEIVAAPWVDGDLLDAGDEEWFMTLAENEKEHIRAALRRSGGVIRGPKGAAALLGVPESTLRYRMKKHGL